MVRLGSRRRWLALLIALAVLCIAAYLRLWQLGQTPAFFHFDEGNNGADALSVLAGNHALFFGANRGREGLIVYGVAAFTALLGRSMLAARLTGALASTLAVAAVFWLGSVVFSPSRQVVAGDTARDMAGADRWRGLVVGALGAGVMAASLGLAILGRTGLRANFLPLLLPLAVALLWTGVRRASAWRLALAGGITGLLAYTYISARFFPFLLLLFAATFLLPNVEGSLTHPLTHTPTHPFTRSPIPWRGLALYAGVSVLVALPMIVYFVLHPEDFSNRSAEVWLFNSQLYDGNWLGTLLRNIWLQLSVLGFAGDPSWRSNYAELPLLHPLEAFFFWLGVAALLVHWRRAYSRLLLLWLGVFLAPAVFSYDLPRNTFRMLAMAPAIYLALGYGFWVAASYLARLAGRNFPRWQQAVVVALVVAAVVLVGGRAAYSADLLFHRWANEVEANVAAPNVEWVDMLNVAALAPADASFVIPTSEVGEYATSSFAYLYQGQAPVHMLDSSQPDFVAQLHELLAADAAAQNPRTVTAVDWDRETVADAPQRIPFLLNKYGQWQASEERTYYRLDSYSDVDVSTPWQLYDGLEPLAISLDGGIALTGIAAGVHGGEQIAGQAQESTQESTQGQTLSVSETLSVLGAPLPEGQDPTWLVLRWQAEQPPKANYRLSLRLVDAANGAVWQQDSQLVDDLNQPTSRWQPGQVVESYHTLALPADLPPGEYELRAIIYDEATLTPIVQVGVWTPEISLAQVQR